jgi:RimJ/RimL family protein N-acetyltransferase
MALPSPVRLTDGQIALRPPEVRDVPAAVTEACQDPEIGRWTRVPWPYREEHARAWVEAQPEEAAVSLLVVGAASDKLLGSMGLIEVDLGQRPPRLTEAPARLSYAYHAPPSVLFRHRVDDSP